MCTGFFLLGVFAAPAAELDHGLPSPAGPANSAEVAISTLDAAILGVVEGVTEFLPISSTGHLILTNRALGLDREVQALDAAGRPIWDTPPDLAAGQAGVPFTVKQAVDTYAVLIQAGAIAAVAIIYWRTILGVFAGLLGRNPAGLRLFRNLLIAFIPAVVMGLTIDDWIEAHLFSIETVAAALVVGAGIMLWADRWQRRRDAAAPADAPDLLPADLSMKQALLIGVLQCVAMWPGMSRSMMTIVGGYFAGLRPARAAEFSFLLGMPTLAGAAAYKALGDGAATFAALGWQPFVVGCIVAAVSAAIAVRGLVAYLTRHGLAVFAGYRVLLAIAVLVFLR